MDPTVPLALLAPFLRLHNAWADDTHPPLCAWCSVPSTFEDGHPACCELEAGVLTGVLGGLGSLLQEPHFITP